MARDEASLPIYHATIESGWIDYNGHLRDAYYGLLVSLAIDDVMDHLGIDAAYRSRTRCTLYTLEIHMHYLHEVLAADTLQVQTSILDADHKRIHAGCRIVCERMPEPVAAADVMLLHVQQGSKPVGALFPPDIEAALQRLKLPAASAAEWQPRSRPITIKRRPGA